MTSSKKSFFAGLHSALESGGEPGEAPRPEPFPTDAEVMARAVAIQKLIAEQATGLMDELAASAEAGGWVVHRAANTEEALGKVVDIARGLGVTSLVRSDHPVLARLGVDGPLAADGIDVTNMTREQTTRPLSQSDEASAEEAVKSEAELRGEHRQAAIDAGLGLTGADYAIAETGSVVLAAGQGVSRIVSLVPPVHVAVVERGSVVPSLDELFTLLRRDYGEQDWASYVNIISGPSRSADIEYTLVTGVHGPGEVHLVLLDEGAS
jgi:L-lactate dehydrogenase complex protein LldG